MSDLSKLDKALKGDADVTAIADDAHIWLGYIPENVTRPCIVYFVATAVPENTLSEAPQVDDQRVQLDMYVPQTMGTAVATRLKEAVLRAIEPLGHVVFGPWNAYEAETKLIRWSLDLEIWNFR